MCMTVTILFANTGYIVKKEAREERAGTAQSRDGTEDSLVTNVHSLRV